MRCCFPKLSPETGPSGAAKPANRSDAAIVAAKAELRRTMVRQRAALSPEERQQAARDLQPHVLELIRRQCTAIDRRLQVAVYAPMRGELRLAADWPTLMALPIQLYFPKIITQHKPYWLRMIPLPPGIQPDDWLRPGHFAVPEPPSSAEEAAEETEGTKAAPALDLVLLPGLAFDRSGGRLGWGKAYYDRYLAACQPQPVTVGIGYDFQLLDQALPLQPHDVRLDWLLTPAGLTAAETVQVC